MHFKSLPVLSLEDATVNFEQLQAFLVPPTWTAPALLNAWANFGAPFETAGYLRDALGFVHLKGLLTTGTSATVAFVLPAGFRPGATTAHASGSGGPSVALVEVAVSGNVTLFGTPANGIGLSGITFLAEN